MTITSLSAPSASCSLPSGIRADGQSPRRGGGISTTWDAPAVTGRPPRLRVMPAIVAGDNDPQANTPSRGGSAPGTRDRSASTRSRGVAHHLTSTTGPAHGGASTAVTAPHRPIPMYLRPMKGDHVLHGDTIDRFPAIPIIRRKGTPAMQVPRKMTEAGQALLTLFTVNREIAADGVITLAETRRQRTAEHRVESLFEQADAGIGLVMSAMKGGPESRTYRDQKREYEMIWGELCYTDPRPANVVPLNTKKRPNRPTGPSAA